MRSMVLLVEDNPVNQTVARGMLRQLGCEVMSVPSGKEAVAAVRNRRFDVILMDCQMPEMDGFTATRMIRDWETDSGLQHHSIVAVTASALAGDRDKCLAAGMDDYLAKPFTLAELREALARNTSATGPLDRSAPAHTPEDNSGLLDRKTIEALKALPDSTGHSVLEAVIDAYCANAAECRERMTNALINQDRKALSAAAHALKSSSGNVGALALARQCHAVERSCDSAEWMVIGSRVEQLVLELEAALQALQREKSLNRDCAA
jgi:CheY-like chemotaxis protein